MSDNDELRARLANAEGLLAFHEGSAKPTHDGAHPVVRINHEDFDTILVDVREAIAALAPASGGDTPQAAGVGAETLRWLDDVAGALQEAGGPTNNMRAVAVRRAITALTAAGAAPEGFPARFVCDGPEGIFWCNDSALANKLIRTSFDRDEWTVTDTTPPAAPQEDTHDGR